MKYLILLFVFSFASISWSQEVLYDFQEESQLKSIQARGIKISIGGQDGQKKLLLNSSHTLVDVCDTPYEETVAAAREIGEKLYDMRAGNE